jgi:hypothetical protein
MRHGVLALVTNDWTPRSYPPQPRQQSQRKAGLSTGRDAKAHAIERLDKIADRRRAEVCAT